MNDNTAAVLVIAIVFCFLAFMVKSCQQREREQVQQKTEQAK